MTQLSNIFIGDKVVQQVYLNDALMYQSNGWQALPTTPQLAWTKSIITYDSDNYKGSLYSKNYYDNTIITLLAQTLIKTDYEGNIIFRKQLDSNADVYKRNIQFDSQGNIWLLGTYDINKYDSAGNLLYKFHFPVINNDYHCLDFCICNDNVFVLIGNYSTYNIRCCFFNAFSPDNRSSTPVINYDVYYSASIFSMSEDKTHLYLNIENNLIQYNILSNTYNKLDDAIAKIVAIDKYDNIYTLYTNTDTNTTYLSKYNFARTLLWNKLIPRINITYYISSNVDDAIYLASCSHFNGTGYEIFLYRIETDGTISWDKTIPIGRYANGNTQFSIPDVDNYGNLYISIYKDNEIQLLKLINLVKS
jgi:hypothetical protein